jgi:curved DNA-binding protein CbpA
MAGPSPDPYQTLGISPGASDDELHAAYRRMVQLHHPDHNRGSAESARRFEAVQEAYTQIRSLRQARPSSRSPRAEPRPAKPRAATDPGVESRLADLERELRQAHLARERARRAAARAAAQRPQRPSDEELGYVSTDDSFSKILTDAAAELSDRFSEAREHPAARRVSDLIDELGSKLTGER